MIDATIRTYAGEISFGCFFFGDCVAVFEFLPSSSA